jgi:hypothetical protein
VSGEPRNIGLGRALASRRQTQAVNVWRAAPDGSGMALHTASVHAWIYVPSGAPALQALAELGGARASHAGELPYDADVREGDELHLGARVFLVERAIRRDTVTWCALSEVRQ